MTCSNWARAGKDRLLYSVHRTMEQTLLHRELLTCLIKVQWRSTPHTEPWTAESVVVTSLTSMSPSCCCCYRALVTCLFDIKGFTCPNHTRFDKGLCCCCFDNCENLKQSSVIDSCKCKFLGLLLGWDIKHLFTSCLYPPAASTVWTFLLMSHLRNWGRNFTSPLRMHMVSMGWINPGLGEWTDIYCHQSKADAKQRDELGVRLGS